MATRSAIIIPHGDQWISISIHNDGYPEHVGRILEGYYRNPENQKKLIELGNLSVLAPSIEKSIAYGRDRGEKNQEAKIFSDRKSALDYWGMDIDWAYIFNNGRWNQINMNG